MSEKAILGLLTLGAVGLGVALLVSGGDESDEGEEMGSSYYPRADLEKDRARFAAARWAPIADRLTVELDDPHDVAVGVAQSVFPELPWPATRSMPQPNRILWHEIERAVYAYLDVQPTVIAQVAAA